MPFYPVPFSCLLRDRSTANNGTLDERLWVQQDANWNVTALINGSGSVVERYVYDPYGLRTVLDASFNLRSSSSYAFVHGFQGLRLDTNVNIYDDRYRILLPTIGRFGQPDPTGFGGADTNFYRFEANSTPNGVDPSGLMMLLPDEVFSGPTSDNFAISGGMIAAAGGIQLKPRPEPTDITEIEAQTVGDAALYGPDGNLTAREGLGEARSAIIEMGKTVAISLIIDGISYVLTPYAARLVG